MHHLLAMPLPGSSCRRDLSKVVLVATLSRIVLGVVAGAGLLRAGVVMQSIGSKHLGTGQPLLGVSKPPQEPVAGAACAIMRTARSKNIHGLFLIVPLFIIYWLNNHTICVGRFLLLKKMPERKAWMPGRRRVVRREAFFEEMVLRASCCGSLRAGLVIVVQMMVASQR